MSERTSLQPESDASEQNSKSGTEDIRERTDRLQRKLGELSKTFDHIEETLAEIGDKPEERPSEK